MVRPTQDGGVRRSLCVGLVCGLLIIEGGMVLLRQVAFAACEASSQWADPVVLAAYLRKGAGFALVVHLVVFGGLVVVSLARPTMAALRFAAWALFAMAVWLTAYMVQGLARIADCARGSLQAVDDWWQQASGSTIAVPELLDSVQGQSIVVLGLVFFVVMHVCLCLAILRPAEDV